MQFAGCARLVWNHFQAINQDRLERHLPILWYNEMAFWLTFLKGTDERCFLNDCHSQILQQKLKDLDRAYRDAFDKQQPLKRLPRKHKRTLHSSFRYPQGFKVENNRVYLPKIGWVAFFKSQKIQGTLKNVTVSKSNNHWYVSIQVEEQVDTPIHSAKTAIGIDMGIAKFAAFSTGETVNAVSSFRQHENKLAILQQHLARKEKYSNNWRKNQRKMSGIHATIGHVRRDFLHKLSTHLSKNHAMIVVEELKIANMSRSAKGSVECPGTRVAAKSGLNKSILDQGFGEFSRQLAYKQDWRGGIFLKVNPRYTSQQCNICGHIDKNNRLSQSQFCCINCGHQNNADVNAAKNVLAAGHAVLACGSNQSAGRKQELLSRCESRSVLA